MADSLTQSVADTTIDLFNRYTLLKIALAVILAASLVGTRVTVTLAGGTMIDTVTKWAYFVAMGVLIGGLLWKHVFVCLGDLATKADAYCAEMYDWIAAGVIAVMAVSGSVVFVEYTGQISSILTATFGVGLLVSVVLGSTVTWRGGSVTAQFRHPLGLTHSVRRWCS